MITRYKINTVVKSVERLSRVVSTYKVGDDIVSSTEDLGWFVCFEGSWERLHVGGEQPDLKVGQKVLITIEGL